MKTIDWLRQHIREWPEECSYICVDDSGEIWLNKGLAREARYDSVWFSNTYDSIEVTLPYGEVLEDNDKIITLYDWNMHEMEIMGAKLECKKWSMESFNEQLKSLLNEAGRNGVLIEKIETSQVMDSSTIGKRQWKIIDVNVEYRM